MDYQQPFGTAAGTAYTNGNPATGTRGSIPPAAAFEYPQREIVNHITKAGYTASNGDLFQLTRSGRSQRLNYVGNFGGTANALTATLDPAPANAADLVGMPIRGIIAAPNTGAVTFSPNGLTGPVRWPDGTALVGREFKTGMLITLMWDGTQYQIHAGGASIQMWTKKAPGFFYAFANPSPGFTTLTASTWTKLAATQEAFDNEGWYDATTSRFQPTIPGFYYITGDASFGSNSTVPTTGLRAFLNGTPSFATSIGDVPGTQYGTSSNGSRGVVSGITQLNGSTDFIEMYGFQDVPDSAGFRRANNLRWGGWFVGA
jgi:hypothetical protein